MKNLKIKWSPKAIKDLRSIVHFIAQDKKQAALKWAQSLQLKVSKLSKFPQLGHMVPEVNRKEIREIIFGSYRIIYKLGNEISILTLFHGAKGFEEVDRID